MLPFDSFFYGNSQDLALEGPTSECQRREPTLSQRGKNQRSKAMSFTYDAYVCKAHKVLRLLGWRPSLVGWRPLLLDAIRLTHKVLSSKGENFARPPSGPIMLHHRDYRDADCIGKELFLVRGFETVPSTLVLKRWILVFFL